MSFWLPRRLIEVISPETAHVSGIVAITFSAPAVVLYFWLRQATVNKPAPHIVERGQVKSSNHAMERTADRCALHF